MIEIVNETSKYSDLLYNVFTNLSVFETEYSKFLILIFEEYMKLEADPNPLSVGLYSVGEKFVDSVLEKISSSSKGHLYTQLMTIFTLQPETHQCLLRTDVIRKLATNAIGVDPDVAKNSLETLEQVLISDTHQDIVSKYIGENYKTVMEILRIFTKSDSSSTRIRGLRLLAEMINRCGSIKDFTESYLDDKDNLEMVISIMEEEHLDIKDSAFELLIIYLYTPKEMKSADVNDLLYENCDKLTSVIEKDLELYKDEKQVKQRKEAVEWLGRIQLDL